MSNNSTILVSALLPQSMQVILEANGYRVIRLRPSSIIQSEVGTHPDILCCKTPSDIFLGDPIVQDQMTDLVDFRPVTTLENGYPNEVLYNCFFYDNYLFASRFTSKVVLQYADDNGYQTVFVKQGYTKCSVAVCGKNNFITADKGICSELEKRGYNVLLINGSDILLKGYSCGFIGGCCGLLNNNLLAFTGRLDKILDGSRINNFLTQNGVDVLELSSDKLYDYGGLIII